GCAPLHLAPATSLSSSADTVSFSVPLCRQRREYNMNAKPFAVLLAGTTVCIARVARAHDEEDGRFPANPRCTSPAITPFALDGPGTNGIAFDRDGNLWTGDGTTGVGRVWRIAPAGGVCEPSFSGCDEVFRIQAMANVRDPVASGGVANVGRDNRSLPPGT